MLADELLSQSRALLKQGNTEQAERLCRTLIATHGFEFPSQTLEDQKIIAEANRILAASLREQGRFREVVTVATLAEAQSRTVQDMSGCSAALGLRGLALMALGDHEGAKAVLAESLEAAVQSNDEVRRAQALCYLGNAYLTAATMHQAKEAYEEAARLARTLQNDSILSVSLGNLGLVYRHIGDFSHSILVLNDAIEIEKRIGNRTSEARHRGNLGSTYLELGDSHRALTLYQEALHIHQTLGHRPNESIWLHNLGALHQNLGNLDIAQGLFEQSIAIEQELGGYLAESRSLVRLAGISMARGEVSGAIQSLEHAISITCEHAMPIEAAIYCVALAEALTRAHRFEDAQSAVDKALQGLTDSELPSMLASAWVAQAKLLAEITNPDRSTAIAIQWLQKALALYHQINDKRNIAEVYTLLATLEKEQQNWETAASHTQQAFDTYASIVNDETRLTAQRAYYMQQLQDANRHRELAIISSQVKEAELERLIDRMVDKNNLLRQVVQQLADIKVHTRPKGAERIEDIIGTISKSFHSEQYNTVMNQLLTDVHQDFVDALRQRIPNITGMELKVAMLLSRQLTSANIADVLYLSKRTVEVHRLNLRKKLGLQKHDDIYQALRQL